MRIAICDDDEVFINEIFTSIKKYSQENNITVETYKFQSGLEIIEMYKRGYRYDIVFLDIDMPTLSGKEVIRELRGYDDKFILIFITSLESEVFELMKYNIFRYIRKRYLKDELKEAYLSATRLIKAENSQYTFETKGGIFKVAISDILYFKLVDRHVELHDVNNVNTLKIKVFNEINDEFKSKGFISIYRGCLVNLRHIRRVSKKEVYLSNGDILQVSRIKIAEVTKAFFDFREEKYRL